MSEIVARCVICSEEFTEEQIQDTYACPGCGTKSVPMSPKNDVSLEINWHELRILSIWAENWARQCDRDGSASNPDEPFNMVYTVMSIVQRLQRQFPDKTKLTLFGEVRELREKQEKGEIPGTGIKTDLDDDSLLGLDDDAD